MLNNIRLISDRQGQTDKPYWENHIVLHYQQHFFEKERELWPSIGKKLIENRSKYLEKEPRELNDRELLRGFKVSGMHYGFSHFSPLWFKWFIEQRKCEHVLDPCGGWGHRLLGTLGTNLKSYTYVDFDERSVKGCERIYNDFHDCFGTECRFLHSRAEEATGLPFYDSLFTCPPYFNKETYKGKSFESEEDFASWWQAVCDNVINVDVKNIGIVIDPINIDVITGPITSKGFQAVEQIPLGDTKNPLVSSRSVKDVMCVFEKNRPFDK
jgi:hypothetical protein